MADRLKAADQGNLFVVFGEPDIDFRKLQRTAATRSRSRALDIFNPNTGELKPPAPTTSPAGSSTLTTTRGASSSATPTSSAARTHTRSCRRH